MTAQQTHKCAFALLLFAPQNAWFWRARAAIGRSEPDLERVKASRGWLTRSMV
ncbi:hypothetical protein [Paraburkholderia sp. 2C]|jgi:hypothetical protein